jgi:hypothetical protein
MRRSFRIESLAALLAGLIVALPLPAAAAEAGTGQIYQQRAADGRIVLTDRPSATAVTERTWQVEREDPVAAQQRANEVRREADAVSERVQRRMEAQERLVAADRERAWQAQRDQQLARADDDGYYPAYGIAGTYLNRPFRYRNTRPPFFEPGTQKIGIGSGPKRPMQQPSHSPGRPTAPAMP